MNDAQTSILMAIVGMVVTTIIMIHIGIVLIESDNQCFASLGASYPNISCGYAEVLYCEWENKTYKVKAFFDTNDSMVCYLDVV